VAREGSITAAAEALHLSQPTLSRQLKDLEAVLGKPLFIRGNRKITLTEEGRLLKKRAREIIELTRKTESEIAQNEANISGDVWIGCGDFEGARYIMRAISALREDYPHIRIHLTSGNMDDILEQLEKGLISFGVFINESNSMAEIEKYETILLPFSRKSGVIMRKESPLAVYDEIPYDLLNEIPIILPRNEGLRRLLGDWADSPNIVASYDLFYNAMLLVEAGLGYALYTEGFFTHWEWDDFPLCFRPFPGEGRVESFVAWKKQPYFSKAELKFLEKLKETV
jgi:DNA-binding transcriptional LysR family regulator